MKEFLSHTGGRYAYVDDILNLQDLSLAFAKIFNRSEERRLGKECVLT